MPKSEIVISEQHSQAVELHQRIMTSAALAQQNLWDMCTSLKEMRDGKLYKELGYSNFEDYCENEVGMKRANAYKYISVVERINPESVSPVRQIGIKKLALLATLSEEQQAEVAERVELSDTTYNKLKDEIDKLKTRNSDLEDAVKDSDKAIEILHAEKTQLEATAQNESRRADNVSRKLDEAKDENARLERENEELRNRPTEVAVVDNSAENDRKLNEVIRSLERENIKRNEELDRKYIEDRRALEADKRREIAALREEYEKKLAEASQSEPVDEDEDKLKFKIFLTSAYDMLNRITEFTSRHSDPIYKEKIKQLLNSVLAKMED